MNSDAISPDNRIMLWFETSLICMACLHTWVGCRPTGSDFNRMQCPECGESRSDLQSEYNARRVLQ